MPARNKRSTAIVAFELPKRRRLDAAAFDAQNEEDELADELNSVAASSHELSHGSPALLLDNVALSRLQQQQGAVLADGERWNAARGLHALPHPAESHMVWCRADSVTADLIHLSYPTVRTVAHRRAAAGPGGERRGLYRFPQDQKSGTTPGPATRLGPAARAPPEWRRGGVRAQLFRVSSDNLRVKRARTPYTARYVKGPRRPTLPGGRLLSHAEGTVDFSLLISLHGAG